MLTPRGLEICCRMGSEQSPTEMARDLGISERSLGRVIRMMSEKTGLSPLKLAFFGYCLAREEEFAAYDEERKRLGPTRVPVNLHGLTDEAILRSAKGYQRAPDPESL